MDAEAYQQSLESAQYAQEIDPKTGQFKTAEAATAAIRCRAFAEVVAILQDATK